MTTLAQLNEALRGLNQVASDVLAMPFPTVPTPRPFDWDKAMHEAAADGAIVDDSIFIFEE